jgi:beta-glucan synthesis-associated protein KRE6
VDFTQYLIINLGMSTNFGKPDLEHLTFPNHMYVDYIRVYQKEGQINVGCDPKDFPTEAYINQYVFIVVCLERSAD